MTTVRAFYELLTVPERRRAALLLVLISLSTVLETLGVALVIPVAALLMQQDLANRYPVVRPWLDALGNPTQARLVAGGMLMLVAIYVVKAAVLVGVAWWQSQYVTGVRTRLSQQLFTTYLRQPYTFHLQRNSAQLISNVTHEASMVGLALTSGMVLVAEGLTLVALTSLLLLAEPVGALVVAAVLGVSAWAFQSGTRASVASWGEARQLHAAMGFQRLSEGLGAAKDVKLLGREGEFVAQYGMHNSRGAAIERRLLVVQQLPRLWLEMLAVAGLAGVVLTMLARGRGTTSIVTVLGLFAAAAFRLIPSVNRIMNARQSEGYALPAVRLVHEELQLAGAKPRAKGTASPEFSAAIEIEQVSYTYPSAATPVLRDLSLRIEPGESVGFVGASGAGKTTLVDVILGLLTPTGGRVLVDGHDIQDDLRGWQDQIGYVPQSVYLTDDTIRRNVAFGLADDQINDAAVVRAIQAAQLQDLISGLASGVNTEVGERGIRLSGGQRQRIGLARAMYHDPSVLVFDEATSALDTATEEGVMEAVSRLQGQKTLVIVAHRLSTVEHCDRILLVEDGRVTPGPALRPLARPAQEIGTRSVLSTLQT